jgi:DNA-directed RNA polymerase specialized sigma24 family protein
MDHEPLPFKGNLDQIETDWSLVHEPAHLVERYSPAIERYLHALIKNDHDAEEVAQEFFLWVSQHGFPRVRQDRGRFRDYLKKVVRNYALNFLRKKSPCAPRADLLHVPAPEHSDNVPDQEWVVQWRRCLLKRAWRRLQKHQERSPDNLFYTVLHLCATFPHEDSRALAARASLQSGKVLRAEAFRKQVSRARRMFAQFLIKEIAETLDKPAAPDVEDELVDLGLMGYVRDFLPLRERPAPG